MNNMNQLKLWNKIFIEKNKYFMNNRETFYNLALYYLPVKSDSIILDIGCGNSSFIELLYQNFIFKNISTLATPANSSGYFMAR